MTTRDRVLSPPGAVTRALGVAVLGVVVLSAGAVLLVEGCTPSGASKAPVQADPSTQPAPQEVDEAEPDPAEVDLVPERSGPVHPMT